ncbi:MAG: S1 family peptidase [Humibacillus sp.]|nr:S1 family peptidase [Humibacillus sp.]MDN5775802.1 S1 family peptidase [Humibacillus sp.]
MRFQVRRRVAVLAGLSFALLLPFAGPSLANTESAGKPDPGYNWTDPPADIEQWRRENLVTEVAQRLVPDPEETGIGYAGMVVSGERLSITMWWHGELPATVRKVVEDANDGVSVQVRPAERSISDIRRAVSRIVAPARIDPRILSANIEVLGTGEEQDGSGISVRYDAIDSSQALPAPDEVRRVLELVAGVPVLAANLGSNAVWASRQDDTSPWYGGGMIQNSGGKCSIGFAGSRNSDGGSVMLSAAHCSDWGQNSSYWYDGTGSELVATWPNISIVSALDSMSMKTQGGSFARVFGGGWSTQYGGYRYTLDVIGSFANHVGNKVCASGANSGEHCNLTITGTATAACGPNGNIACPAWEAQNPSNDYAVVSGDSGGPLYQNTGQGNVRAQGIISYTGSYRGNATFFNCTGLGGTRIRFGGSGVACSDVVGYIDVSRVLSQRGITLKNSGTLRLTAS